MTSDPMTTPPRAHVLRFRPDPSDLDRLELDVLCPYCGCEHRHGAHINDGPTSDTGPRAAASRPVIASSPPLPQPRKGALFDDLSN